MRTFKPQPDEYIDGAEKGEPMSGLTQAALDRFSIDLLGLGDVGKESHAIDSVAAVFDLEGFTQFCKQIEPHLSVPTFLSEFLNWIIEGLKAQGIKRKTRKGAIMWNALPYYMKFMGDGLLVLWDASLMNTVGCRNVAVSAQVLCNDYQDVYLPRIARLVVDPPPALRCGLARGTVFSVGDNGSDYVGSCINMAARLQKLPGIHFAINIRGFDWGSKDAIKAFGSGMIVRKVAIRGIGENELVAIPQQQFDDLSEEDAQIFRPA